jgi:hypothetical protein
MTAPAIIQNSFDPKIATSVDPWAANGLADEYREAYPEDFAIATRVNGPVPKMFVAGKADLPDMVSAGYDPAALMRVPWRMRHYVAAEPVASTAHALIEKNASDPEANAHHEGLKLAYSRIKEWASVPADQLTEAESAALFERIYAPVRAEEARRGDRLAAYQAGQPRYL